MRRNSVQAVAACHFIAAFAALGLPPFFPLLLDRSFQTGAPGLAGGLYVLPTLCAALSAPLWGRLTDRYGAKPLLLRAQLGLAVSFVIPGLTNTPEQFALSLALQGVLGGTFAASNAYLGAQLRGAAFVRALTLMQGSARAALVVAPATLALFMAVESPVRLYLPLAALPLLAALLLWRLPAGQADNHHPKQPAEDVPLRPRPTVSPLLVFTLEAVFVFSTIVTFPYFITHVQGAGVPVALSGLLFAAPHLTYLLFASPGLRLLSRIPPVPGLTAGFAVLLVALLAQMLPSTPLLIASRLLMGLAMTACYVWLHALVAGLSREGQTGRLFGHFEAVSKLAAVLAGVSAGLVVAPLGTQAPFALGATVLAVTITGLLTHLGRRAFKETYVS